jgi:hypothetical protein
MLPTRSRARPLLFSLLLAIAAACHRDTAADHDGGSAATAAGIGVPECDSYLGKYEKCIERAPADRRKPLHENLDGTRAAWKALADNPGARPGLAQACSLALDTARTSMTQYDCTW